MLGLVAVFLLFGFALTALLFVGGTWLQGYLYSEPEEELVWRAPVAGTIITLVAVIWAIIDFKSIKSPDQPAGSYTSFFTLSTEQNQQYTELWAVQSGQKTHYKIQKTATGKPIYKDAASKSLPSRVDTVIVQDGDRETRFDAARDAQGYFIIDQAKGVIYRASDGREMTEQFIGEVTTRQPGVLFGNVLLNSLHLTAWFACFWLILRFQWHHAMGLAVVFWLVMSLLVMPMVLSRVEDVARDRVRLSQSEARRDE